MSNIEDDVKYVKEMLEIARVFFMEVKAETDYKDVDEIAFCNAISNILSEREQLLKEKKDDKQDIKDFQSALNEENLRCANYAIENNELKKRIKELEAKLEFKKYGDLDEIEFEEYMSHFIPKQKVKDILNEIQEEYDKVQEQFDCIWNKKSKDNYDRYKLQELSAMQQELGFILGKFEKLLEEGE